MSRYFSSVVDSAMSELVLGEMYRALTMADFHTSRIGKRKMSVARFNLVAEETAKAVARTGRVQLYFSPFCLHRCHSVVHLVWIGQAHILAHELEFLKGLVVQPHPFHSDKMERKSKVSYLSLSFCITALPPSVVNVSKLS